MTGRRSSSTLGIPVPWRPTRWRRSLRALNELVDFRNRRVSGPFFSSIPSTRLTYLNAPFRSNLHASRRELAGISDYYDFSGLNSVTTNNYYYYETSHYRLLVGDMMLKVMLGEPDVQVPPGFGVHVTRDECSSTISSDQCRELQPTARATELSGKNETCCHACDRARLDRDHAPGRADDRLRLR